MESLWNTPFSATCVISSRFTPMKEPTTSIHSSWENTSPACPHTSNQSSRVNGPTQEGSSLPGFFSDLSQGLFLERDDTFGHSEARPQLIGIERLGDEIVGPRFHAFKVILFSDQRSDDDDERIFRLLVFADAPAQFETIHFRHQHIGDDQTEPSAAECFPCFLPVFSRNNFVRQLFKYPPQELARIPVVFSDQYFHW